MTNLRFNKGRICKLHIFWIRSVLIYSLKLYIRIRNQQVLSDFLLLFSDFFLHFFKQNDILLSHLQLQTAFCFVFFIIFLFQKIVDQLLATFKVGFQLIVGKIYFLLYEFVVWVFLVLIFLYFFDYFQILFVQILLYFYILFVFVFWIWWRRVVLVSFFCIVFLDFDHFFVSFHDNYDEKVLSGGKK